MFNCRIIHLFNKELYIYENGFQEMILHTSMNELMNLRAIHNILLVIDLRV